MFVNVLAQMHNCMYYICMQVHTLHISFGATLSLSNQEWTLIFMYFNPIAVVIIPFNSIRYTCVQSTKADHPFVLSDKSKYQVHTCTTFSYTCERGHTIITFFLLQNFVRNIFQHCVRIDLCLLVELKIKKQREEPCDAINYNIFYNHFSID